MEHLIIASLHLAFERLEKIIPKTKIETKHFNISDVSPLDISRFIIENNIPSDCYFWGEPNSYDTLDYPTLCYGYNVPLTPSDIEYEKRRRFTDIAYQFIKKILIENDFVINPVNYFTVVTFNRAYNFKSVYDSYISNDFNILSIYYSLTFKKNINILI